jgi:amidase/aspartyl-tRNA(Asn)/glutamyl-tRNA(Gln) amidotransferase subunit A
MHTDLHNTLKLIRSGQTSPQEEMDRSIDKASSEGCQHVFIASQFEDARIAAAQPDTASQPLAGLAVSIKDLFDVRGQATRAGSLVLQDAPVATQDCLAVSRLRQAGAALIGRTNMSEFAFSGVGVNPHFGTPINACSKNEALIPGGSSSGAAISVATGAAWIGLGSDTGGSIRIPAALNGIVGFKNTARLVPTSGSIPLSTTLDTVCALTRSVADAVLAHEILAQRTVTRRSASLSAYQLAIPTTLMLDGLDPQVSKAWQRTLKTLRDAGAQLVEITLSELNQLQQIQSYGGFSAAESYAWHATLLKEKRPLYDPRVAARINKGAAMTACEYINLQHARRKWIQSMELAMCGFDAFLSPTVPIIAPAIATVAPGAERDEAFFEINAQLLRNPSVINMLDGCAISIPCHAPNELPVGLMIWAQAMRDDSVLNVALLIESLLQK